MERSPFLLREAANLRWFGPLIRMPPLWRSARHVQLGGRPVVDPKLAGGDYMSHLAWDPPGGAGKCWWVKGLKTKNIQDAASG